jgi:predicted Zn-dependent peptidase
MTHPKVTRGYVFAMCKAPGYADDRRYAASVVAHILGGSDNSRMHWSLIEPGIAEEAQSSFDPHDGFGEFFVYASGEPASLDEIWSICRRDMLTLRDSLTQQDLDLLLNKFVTGITLGGERPHDRMHRLGRTSMYLDRYIPLEEELDRLQALTVADLRAVCDDFPLEPVTIGKLLPEKTDATAASAAPPTRP